MRSRFRSTRAKRDVVDVGSLAWFELKRSSLMWSVQVHLLGLIARLRRRYMLTWANAVVLEVTNFARLELKPNYWRRLWFSPSRGNPAVNVVGDICQMKWITTSSITLDYARFELIQYSFITAMSLDLDLAIVRVLKWFTSIGSILTTIRGSGVVNTLCCIENYVLKLSF